MISCSPLHHQRRIAPKTALLFHCVMSECDDDNCTLNCQSTKSIKSKNVNFSYHNNVIGLYHTCQHVLFVGSLNTQLVTPNI